MSGKQKPLIRFKGFTEAWEQRKLGEVLDNMYNGQTPSRNKSEYWNGNIKWLTSGELNRGTVHDSIETITEVGQKSANLQIVPKGTFVMAITGLEASGTRGNCALLGFNTTLNQSCMALFPKKELFTSEFLFQWYRKVGEEYGLNYTQGTKQQSYNAELIKILPISLPLVDEQNKISSYLSNLDHLITLHQRKLEKLKNIKKSCLEKMFPNNGKNIPEIRFFGFTEAWEQRKLGDMMNVTSVKRIHQSDWTDSGIRFLRARDIVSAYKNEEPDNYLYISKEKYDEYSLISGKVSIGDMLVTGVGTIGVPYLVDNSEPLYFKDGNIIWFKNEDRIDGKFLFYAFFGKSIQNYIIESAGIGTVGTYTIESGKNTPITLPKKEEQKLIGIYFQQLDYLITLHQRKLEKLKNIKKSMLEKMFV